MLYRNISCDSRGIDLLTVSAAFFSVALCIRLGIYFDER
ncbi:hypothetical protein PhaeoP18_01901 [Phaeobacter piscinae]|uniref:Uncharacterized protein n=1 Tax=Phaeobacter piscinae TaxID=1580596 RepID=A0AAN1GRW4_9RHOB|nr:hypothetical protein PhaeoP13_01924 [Phaeobacter piscinae]AUR36165.1 hypothetical protein PhaeoP18_01901 [Phaeobacter piscinae]